MLSLQQNSLNFNSNVSFDFGGGNISSDSGLLPIRAFIEKLGLRPILESCFNDGIKREHSIASIIEQLIYTNIAGYHQDDTSDALRLDPVFTSILNKDSLASQPTISRALNGFDENSIKEFNDVLKFLFEKGNKPKDTKHIVLDVDSTNIETFGKQENSAFIYHYSTNGYHPLVLYNGLNGDLMKFELRKGNVYTSNGIKDFLEPVLKWLEEVYPKATILIRADSGFAIPELYDLAEEYGIEYIIRLKANASLRKYAKDANETFYELYGTDYSQNHAFHDDFAYQAGSWEKERRVVCRVERSSGELAPRTTFIITSLSTAPKTVVKTYNKRGNMENFIKETKLDFGMRTLSHSSFLANHVKAMILSIAYSIINIMKRLVMPKEYAKSRMISIRSIFIKVACRAIKSARKVKLRLCSSFPYKDKFLHMMSRIDLLSFS